MSKYLPHLEQHIPFPKMPGFEVVFTCMKNVKQRKLDSGKWQDAAREMPMGTLSLSHKETGVQTEAWYFVKTPEGLGANDNPDHVSYDRSVQMRQLDEALTALFSDNGELYDYYPRANHYGSPREPMTEEDRMGVITGMRAGILHQVDHGSFGSALSFDVNTYRSRLSMYLDNGLAVQFVTAANWQDRLHMHSPSQVGKLRGSTTLAGTKYLFEFAHQILGQRVDEVITPADAQALVRLHLQANMPLWRWEETKLNFEE